MSVEFENPYLSHSFTWVRGNLHTHTTNSPDGRLSPQRMIDHYAARGYGFLAITDHDTLTQPETLDPRGLILIPGNEVTKNGTHLLQLCARAAVSPHADRQEVIEEIRSQGGEVVLCHPNWGEHHDHYTREHLSQFHDYLGLEIYNGVMRGDPGGALATDRWDELLTQGRRVWGFAHDDAHAETDLAAAWNVVQMQDRNVGGVMESLRLGRFYASTGVDIVHIGVAGFTVSVRARNATKVTAVVDSGRVLAQAQGASLTVQLAEDAPWTYVRFECQGRAGELAWTQPFFLKHE